MNQSIAIFEVNSKPYGTSYVEWTRLWWRWLVSIPNYQNPAFDRTGQFCDLYQPYSKVWFLAGTFSGSVTRKCTVPYGKALLLPVINYETSDKEEPSASSDEQLEAICSSEIDDIKNISVSIDNNSINIRKYRIQSGCFEIDTPSSNCLGITEGMTKFTSDGFWLFLKPLPVGKHLLSSFGSCKSGRIRIGCTFQLIIENSETRNNSA